MALTLAADAVVPLILRRRLWRGKEDATRIGERLGHAGMARPQGQLVWFHAASVGESLSILPLIGQLRFKRPDVAVLITTGTRSSADLLSVRLPVGVLHQFVPIDSAGAVARFLDHWHPDLAVWTESELWPRLIVATQVRGIPMLLINARMSAASARRWRWVPGMIAGLLGRFDQVLTQDQATADLFRHLGLPADRVTTAGTLKVGSADLPFDPDALAALRRVIGNRPIWLAASTHPGEEAIVAAAHARLLNEHPDLLLVLAPRHPDRAQEVAAILRAAGLTLTRRSEGGAPVAQAYLADTLGEMGLWYRLSPIAFVGGSLVPVGGHNPYEPAAQNAAILTGPHVTNFADIFARLLAGGGAQGVVDAETLADAVRALSVPTVRQVQAGAARAIAAGGDDATNAARRAILDRLPEPIQGRA